MKGVDAVPELPLLVTVAVPGAALPGTFVICEARPLASAVAEPRACDVLAPALVNEFEVLSPAEKNWPVILNGAVA